VNFIVPVFSSETRSIGKINNCHLSKNDTKSLLWENNKTKIDIPAKYGSAYFCLVFPQEQPLQINNQIYCGVVNEKSINFIHGFQQNKHCKLLDLGFKTSCVKVNLEFM
jgi:hypothetical protein